MSDVAEPSTGRISLRVVGGPHERSDLPFGEELILGREVDGEGRLADPAVSRRHAVIRRADGRLNVEDLGSSNGTLVNGERISRPTDLRHGDTLQVGNTVIEIVDPDMANSTAAMQPISAEPATAAVPAVVPDMAQPEARDTASALGEAKQLYGAGRLAESETLFRQAAADPALAAEALYGVGLVKLHTNDLHGAEQFFRDSLAREPGYLNSTYQLGVIAERRGDVAAARAIFQQVLATNPSHASARQAMARLAPPASPPPVTAPPDPGPFAAPDEPTLPPEVAMQRYGVYEYLLQDKSPLSRDTLHLMDELRLDARPYLGAYLGKILVQILVAIAFVAGAASLANLGKVEIGTYRLKFSDSLPLIAAGIAFVLIAYSWLKILTTKVRIERGRMQIEKGILNRNLTSIELWRVEDIELRRTFLQRLTGHGILRLRQVKGDPKKPLEVVGLARGKALQDTYQKMLNLVFLMRGNPVVKGIIT